MENIVSHSLHTVSWPLRHEPEVVHIGTMQEQDKGTHGSSLEGRGLSVSVHPEAWEYIARLGGLPRWRLCRADAAFVDAHALGKAHKDAVERWGIEQGLLERAQRFECSWFDEELDDRMRLLCRTQREAEEESAEHAADNVQIRPVHVPVATAALGERVGFAVDDLCAFDLTLTEFVAQAMDFDGVWWEDTLDIAGLSAPRGVIVPERLGRWSRQRIAA